MLCQQVKLSCGQQHTAVISSSGNVYTWGKSHKGRLGHGDLIEEEGKSTPFRVEILHMHRIKVLSVACGIEHTLALCRDGVYAWGSSEYGQLGQGDNKQHTRPVFITELSDKTCIAVACGHYHSIALSADQRVWSWGWGVHGQLGMGSIEDVLLPSHVASLDHVQVTQMTAGYSHTVVMTTEGQVYTFGGGLYGQLGLGTNSKQTLPRLVEALKNEHISLICCGSFETVAVSSDQKVYNWGRNPNYVRLHMKPDRTKRFIGQGFSSSGALSHRLLPSEVNCVFDSRIVEIHCGSLHYLAVTDSGEVYTWGFNDHGQMGYGNKMEDQMTPKVVPSLKDKHIVTASVGAEFSVAMDTAGQVFVWGRADSGQLGLDASLIGAAKEIPIPSPLTSLPLLINEKSTNLSESLNSSEQPTLDVDWKLPDLSQLGNKGTLYGRESLTVALHALYLHYSANQILRHCLDVKDCLSASVVYNNLNHWSEALGIRLKFLSNCYEEEGTVEQDEFLGYAVNVINNSLRIIAEKDGELYGYTEQLLHILQEILNFWAEHSLPQKELESILSDHLTKIAYSLSLLIIRNPTISSPHEQTNSDGIKAKNFSKLQFSSEFLTTITELVASQIQSEQEGSEFKEDITQMLSSSRTNDDTGQVEFTFGPTEEKTMSTNQLMEGIMENLKRDLDKSSSISLSMTTAATIAAAAVSQPKEGQHSLEQDSPDVVVFTCNHQFPKVYFLENVLPEFQQRMSELLIPLVNTTKALLTHYKKSESILLAACPVCVYNSLRSEQLERASDVNTVISNGFKAKPWDI